MEQMSPEEALAYWIQRALDAEKKLEDLAAKREHQALQRRRAIELFHHLTREWDVETSYYLYQRSGRSEFMTLPVPPEAALEHVARVYRKAKTAQDVRTARRWLLRARAELPYGEPASLARIPHAWDE